MTTPEESDPEQGDRFVAGRLHGIPAVTALCFALSGIFLTASRADLFIGISLGLASFASYKTTVALRLWNSPLFLQRVSLVLWLLFALLLYALLTAVFGT